MRNRRLRREYTGTHIISEENIYIDNFEQFLLVQHEHKTFTPQIAVQKTLKFAFMYDERTGVILN